MGKRKKKKHRPLPKPKPFYPLQEIKQLVINRNVLIRSDVRDDAENDFGFDETDILESILKLQQKHFYKTDPSNFDESVMLDFYKAKKIKGEDIYIHLYITDRDRLIINSFKKL